MANMVLFMNILIGTSNPGLTLYANGIILHMSPSGRPGVRRRHLIEVRVTKPHRLKVRFLKYAQDQFAMTDGLDTANHSLHINFKIDGNGKVDFDIYLARIFA